MVNGALHGSRVSGSAELDESCSLMQDVPHDFTQPVSDGPDSLDITEADYEGFEDSLQLTPVGSDGGLNCWAQQAPHEPIALGGPAGMVLPSALLASGTNTYPGCQLL